MDFSTCQPRKGSLQEVIGNCDRLAFFSVSDSLQCFLSTLVSPSRGSLPYGHHWLVFLGDVCIVRLLLTGKGCFMLLPDQHVEGSHVTALGEDLLAGSVVLRLGACNSYSFKAAQI